MFDANFGPAAVFNDYRLDSPFYTALILFYITSTGLHMTDIKAVNGWKAALGELQVRVDRHVFDTWLRDTRGLSIERGVLLVGVATPFSIEWLERRMYPTIRETVQRVVDGALDVEFRSTPVLDTARSPLEPARPGTANGRRPGQSSWSGLNRHYTFPRFVVGSSNRLPYSAAMTVAETPENAFQPLFIHSPAGLGKTHLLQAIGHTSIERGDRILYVTAEQFTSEFIAAIRSRSTDDFRAKYRSVDVLLVDDVQFLAGKEQTQEAFFHTFNDLYNSSGQVVLASDRPPRDFLDLEDRLRSRFEWGLMADISVPDMETRAAILRNKASDMSVSLEEPVLHYAANYPYRNVRELEGCLNRVVAMARLYNSPITMDLVAQAIADLLPDFTRAAVGPETILEQVGLRFSVGRENLIGTSRKKGVLEPRRIAMYLMHEELAMSDTDIGRLMGGRNHSTVISALSKINRSLHTDSAIKNHIIAIKEALISGAPD